MAMLINEPFMDDRYITSMDIVFVVLLLSHIAVSGCQGIQEPEIPPYDGWYNNLNNPEWGAAETPLVRRSKATYSDGVYGPSGGSRPNPLDISRAVHHGPAGRASYVGRTAMLVYFGQQVVEEIVDSQRPGCPIEYFNIPVPKGHKQFDKASIGDVKMTFKRSRYDQTTGYSPNNPRQQLNEITPYLDGQVIYGPNKAWADAIRELKAGRLATTNSDMVMLSFPPNNTGRLPYNNPPVAREHKLRPVSRFHAIGNPRGHENPFLLSFGVLWFRWHNIQAGNIARRNPDLNDEQIFNHARRLVIAQYQKIVFYDWLPIWLNTSMSRADFKHRYPYYRNAQDESPYNGYNPSVHPGIFQEFQSAAMRFGHTLVTPGLWRRGGNDGCKLLRSAGVHSHNRYAAIRLCNSYWDSRTAVEEDINALFRGMASTIAEAEDAIMVPDLTESLFGPLEFSRRDLAALNIQRGRDHGIADYNTVRESYGLDRKKDWGDITRNYNSEELERLRLLYDKSGASIDDIDVFTGGMLETTPDGPGELFHKIILEQFLRIRHGDRFWFENCNSSGLTELELENIWNTELVDIINTATAATSNQIQRNVFLFRDQDADGQSCQKQPMQLDPDKSLNGVPLLEPCSELETFDYFEGSGWSFVSTFFLVGLCIPVTFLIMYLLSKYRRQNIYKSIPPPAPLQRTGSTNMNEFRAVEWIDFDTTERIVVVNLTPTDGCLNIYSPNMVLLRYTDLTYQRVTKSGELQRSMAVELHLSSDKGEAMLALKLLEYDLVLKFYDEKERRRFVDKIEGFLNARAIENTRRSLVESYILRNAVTRKHRQERLNNFFKKVFSMFQEGETAVEENVYGTVNDTSEELTRIELTQAEFGEAFGLKPNSTFVRHMFLLVDSDKSGRVSFKEFLDIFILLSSDNIENKVRLLFNMYDINCRGYLASDDISQMVRSLLGLSEENVTDRMVVEFADAVYRKAGLRVGTELTFSDFKQVFGSGDYAETLKKASLGLNDAADVDSDQAATLTVPGLNSRMNRRRSTLVKGYSLGPPPPSCTRNISITSSGDHYATLPKASISTGPTLNVFTEYRGKAPTGFLEWWDIIRGYLETYRLQVFWLTLYCLVTIGVFVERAYFYAVERESGGLRRIAGHGVTISRGSASVIMFTYASLMFTMCKNIVTALRETALHRFVPFDSFHSFHKFIACISLGATILHVIFHGCNLYHICTQPSTDVNCYLREYFRASHELASFHYWAFGTITGLSGIIVTILVLVLFVFALPYARRNLFHAFQNTHTLYIPIYILIMIHGSARMVQEPHFGYYLIGPAILFTIDKLISYSRNTLEITVVKADLLPSDVTAIKVKKPASFEYKSGQWAQVACSVLGKTEFHPFTMTSSPNEKYLTFHIRAVGPWTNNVRRVFDPSNRRGNHLPKLLLDGPFGEGHQDWYKYEVAILIGGGIGVTPFASILKDIVHRSEAGLTNMHCKKVYFLWVTRTQKQFEWVTDIIRDLESKDRNNMVTTHIFVTEFRTKFDLRTSMLYICERHFQKIAGKSLFTGLAATTHFGRPRFYHFLDRLRYTHKQVRQIGVFSCGPRPMTLAVERACTSLNKFKFPTYYHHYENF